MLRFTSHLLIGMSKSGSSFYAVRRGRVPGIYKTWAECEKQVKGFSNAAFKKFSSHEESLSFINAGPVGKILGPTTNTQIYIPPGPRSKRPYCSTSNPDLESTKRKFPKFDNEEDNFTGTKFSEEEGTHVYTDGGCFQNGRHGARAGLGVYWAPNDPLNISEKLSGRQTNNRAEIYAAVRAVQVAKKKGIQNLILHTDSQFLINSITKWIKGWKKKGWTKTTGSPVTNRDDFKALDKELNGVNVKWVYVKGHCGDIANECADKLAKEGAEKPDCTVKLE